MKIVALFSALIASVAALPPVTNSIPINGYTAAAVCAEPRTIVADAQSLCYFYVCETAANGAYRLTPKRCSLGTFIASNFERGLYNPCTGRFPIMGTYDCTRKDTGNVCTNKLNCTNGASLQQEGDLCWCNCSPEWQGAPDCSVRKGTTPVPPLNTVCPGGAPLDNWCAKALPNGANPCQNGGVCINQCTNFICNCTVPNVKDKVCNLAS